MLARPLSRLLALLVATTLLAAFPLSAAAQETEEPQGTEDEDDQADRGGADEDKRLVKVSVASDGVKIELERESAVQEDKVEVTAKLPDAEFLLKYEGKAGENKTEMELQARFLALAEYRDANGNGRYDPGEPIVSVWALSPGSEDEEVDGNKPNGTVGWQSPTASDVTEGGTSGKKIHAPGQLGTDGSFELVFWVFGDYVDLAGSTLKPTSVKIDVIIRDYPYQASDTALAMLLRIESKSESQLDRGHEEMDDDEEGVAASADLGGAPVSLVFTWKDSAKVDGASSPVRTTTLRSEIETEQKNGESKDERKEQFALSYARGSEIVHDPELYVAIGSADTGFGIPGWTGGAALVAAAVATLALAGRRQRP